MKEKNLYNPMLALSLDTLYDIQEVITWYQGINLRNQKLIEYIYKRIDDKIQKYNKYTQHLTKQETLVLLKDIRQLLKLIQTELEDQNITLLNTSINTAIDVNNGLLWSISVSGK